jgi:acyl-CoA synthetase (AMP-forming)/AMP-acid ligase II
MEAYALALVAMAKKAGADLLVVEASYRDDLPVEQLTARGLDLMTYEELQRTTRIEPDLPDAQDVVFVQYSSGTSAQPRGCQLTAQAIEAQLERLTEALALDVASDRGAMWLPLSHDMGFFGGLLLFWRLGLPGLLSSPGRFLVSPRGWLDECAHFGATLTATPNFALDLAARAVARRGPSSPLSLRACIIGGEEVQTTTLQRAADALAPFGLPPEALTPAYGLAEATLAATVADVKALVTVTEVDADALAHGAVEPVDNPGPDTTSLVSVGPPLRDVKVGVAGSDGVGELVIESPSLASGYVGEPRATAAHFRDGMLRTGDLGFVMDREVYVVGRDDDVIVLAGRNIDARRVEQALCAHPELRPGSAVIVARHDGGRPNLVAYVEPRTAKTDTDRLVRELAETTRSVMPLPVEEWVFLRRGRIPRTPSGKTQRYQLRQSPPPEQDVIARVVSR